MNASETMKRLYSRAAFGPRPGDLSGGRSSEPREWIERQLAPTREPALDRRLAGFEALDLDPRALPVGLMREGRRGRGRAPQGNDSEKERRARKERLRAVISEVVAARLTRAVHAEYQLREVMIDFWSNHFSVFARKGFVGAVLPHYQRHVLEPHALGRFRDLLMASARSPAMLIYLDNWTSVAPQQRRGRRGRRHRSCGPERGEDRGGRAEPARRGRGLNENYARELLELHTLGVDGGYTQQDVREVARVFTGWTLAGRRQPSFEFRERLHDPGPKTVLGRRVAGGGVHEGEQLLARLAAHPSTAQFVSRKLAARFVADDPPRALVDRAAARFLETDGNIAAVVGLILRSDEFSDPSHRKLKTPLRFAISALRATGGETDGGRHLQYALRRLGEVPCFARTPAGYPEAASSWIDPAAMLERMSTAFGLTSGRLQGTRLGDAWPEGLTARASVASRRDQLAIGLASPEFQWT